MPDQTVAGGLTLATGINGGDALGIGLVWNARGRLGACTAADDANTWELEYTNSVKIDTPALEPVPLNLLTELPVGGPPVCLAGGSSYYLEMYYSTYHHTVAFIAGPANSRTRTCWRPSTTCTASSSRPVPGLTPRHGPLAPRT